MRSIEIVPYDPRWPAVFRAEAARLRAALGSGLVSLHHIGSTAVPGMPAKPVLDVMPLVRDIALVDAAEAEMVRLGYEPRGENGIPGRRYFVREEAGRRTHHVHAFEADHPAVARHLDFRDFLRAHPDEAQRYAALKVRLSERYPHDPRRYSAAKGSLIGELLERASAWRETGRTP